MLQVMQNVADASPVATGWHRWCAKPEMRRTPLCWQSLCGLDLVTTKWIRIAAYAALYLKVREHQDPIAAPSGGSRIG